ncbi:MAG: hypothetical protein ACP5EP_11450 [Acidobacteriaceae bacterium]
MSTPPWVKEQEDRVLSWQAPPKEEEGHRIAGWFSDLVAQGDDWVRSQPGISSLGVDIQLLMGTGQDRDVPSNLLQPDIRSFVETITDLRQIATMGSKAKQSKKTVALYNDIFKFVFWDSHYVSNTRKALQWAIMGRGYKWQKFSRPWHGIGRPRIVFEALGPREFLPDQLPHNNDIGNAYAGTIVYPMGLAEAHSRFPRFQKWLSPISQYARSGNLTVGMARRYDFYDRFRFPGNNGTDWPDKFCEIRYHFVHDLRINDTGYTQQMGVDGSTWGYKVPTLGDLIVSTDPNTGLPRSRKASVDDCRMYPRMRLVITSPSCPVPLYDDTAFDMHGMIPITQHDVNDWPWSALGYSLVHGVKALEVARRDRISEINTVLSVRKDPPMGTDISTGVSRTQMDHLDVLHAQGIRIGGKGDPSKWSRSLLPEGVSVDNADFEGVKLLDGAIKSSLGLSDIASLREVKGNLSDNAMDKIVENLGPVAKGIALNQWIANSKDANMLKYNIAQYFTVDMLMDMIGPEGVGIETFDNDPNTLVPSHVPGENTTGESAYSRMERAQWYCEKMKVINTPAQLLNVTHIQERMLNMFLIQQKLPVDMEQTMEKVGVPDYGIRHERWKEEQLEDAIWKLEVEKTLQEKMKSLGIQAPPPEGKEQGKGGGRKQSGEKGMRPSQKGSKSGNVRVVNKSS